MTENQRFAFSDLRPNHFESPKTIIGVSANNEGIEIVRISNDVKHRSELTIPTRPEATTCIISINISNDGYLTTLGIIGPFNNNIAHVAAFMVSAMKAAGISSITLPALHCDSSTPKFFLSFHSPFVPAEQFLNTKRTVSNIRLFEQYAFVTFEDGEIVRLPISSLNNSWRDSAKTLSRVSQEMMHRIGSLACGHQFLRKPGVLQLYPTA